MVIPALNEQENISLIIKEIQQLSSDNVLAADYTPHATHKSSASYAWSIDDIVVCDNGSTDETAEQALSAGATVAYESIRGYGAACLKALSVLKLSRSEKPDIVVFIDADQSVNIAELPQLLVDLIEQDADLVIGSRRLGQQLGLYEKGAMSYAQKLGNRLAVLLVAIIWHYKMTDLGPFRAIRYSALQQLGMQDQRFGWTIEMQVKAIQSQMTMIEVPVSCRRRVGHSKISGTFSGIIGAAAGIIGTIFKLAFRSRKAET